MSRFNRIYSGGHLYRPGGEDQLDIGQFLLAEAVAYSKDLPGFDHGGTTYESHHFRVHFLYYARESFNPDGENRKRFSGVLVDVHHGAGWEVWRGDYLTAEALARYGDDDKGLFWMCWTLADIWRDLRSETRKETRREMQAAFVEGRLKKRKLPGRNAYKVWIEQEAETSATEIAV